MSLMTKTDVLRIKANQVGANEIDILRAALLESQERYNKQSQDILSILQKYDERIETLEKVIASSNKKNALDIELALNNAADKILGQVKERVTLAIKSLDEVEKKIKEARQEAENSADSNEFKNFLQTFVIIVLAFVIGGYISNFLYGWWYDVPNKLTAVNDALYQILNR